jgi:hypothetical protein
MVTVPHSSAMAEDAIPTSAVAATETNNFFMRVLLCSLFA